MIKENLDKEKQPTFTEQLRQLFKQPLTRIGKTLHGWGITANSITAIGFVGTFAGSILIALGMLTLGGLIISFMAVFDAFDGAVARASGKIKPFGAFIDSVIDRYIETIIYAGLAWYFMSAGESLGVILSVFALSGSVLVSYTRARAEGLGLGTKVGILTRVERMVVLGPTVIFQVPLWGVAIVAVLANVTAVQRILDVRRQTSNQENQDS